jgi:hypothetical protein
VTQFPLRKKDGLSAQQVGTEVVLFHEATGKAICLNQMSAAVWEHCDGSMSVAAIAEAATAKVNAPITAELVQYALRELRQKGLLENEEAIAELLGPMVSRRAMVQKLGKGAAILLPIVAAVAIPRKAHASRGGGGCVLPDTSIQLANGSMLPAASIVEGMWLRSFDPDSGEVRDGRVAHVFDFAAPEIHTLFTERGDVLRATPSHLLIAGKGDVHGTALGKFRVDDFVMVYDQFEDSAVLSRVTGVQVSRVPQTVYNFEMWSVEHTYVSANVVSHNMPTKQDSPDNGDDN